MGNWHNSCIHMGVFLILLARGIQPLVYYSRLYANQQTFSCLFNGLSEVKVQPSDFLSLLEFSLKLIPFVFNHLALALKLLLRKTWWHETYFPSEPASAFGPRSENSPLWGLNWVLGNLISLS